MNILDTRDLNTRLEELESEYEILKDCLTEAEEALQEAEEPETDEALQIAFADARDDLQEFEEGEDFAELKELRSLKEEIYSWRDGEVLIPEDDWEEYCEELCKDLGFLASDAPWWIVIDWEATAANIAQDYSTVDFQGTNYYYRNV